MEGRSSVADAQYDPSVEASSLDSSSVKSSGYPQRGIAPVGTNEVEIALIVSPDTLATFVQQVVVPPAQQHEVVDVRLAAVDR
jgi:hypothetical protein